MMKSRVIRRHQPQNRLIVEMTSFAVAARRRSTPTVQVGKVLIGGDHPVVVQSMTNTDTADIRGTARQIAELARAGSELVRITVNTPEAAASVPKIRDALDAE